MTAGRARPARAAGGERPKSVREPIHGVLVLDKPVGPSSAGALGNARWLLGAAKAGHGGTLDPLASGVLPVLLGEATKFAADLLEADKEYVATVRFGETTAACDAEGDILERRPAVFDEAALLAACAAQVGRIAQVPPTYSALKKDGKSLYEYARAGIAVDVPAREVDIHAVELLSLADPATGATGLPVREAIIRVACGKGTYIRSVARDLGEALGCGAHLAALRRTRVGDLSVSDAVTKPQLESLTLPERRALLRPLDTLLETLARVDVTDADARRFLQGQTVPGTVSVPARGTDQRVRVYGHGCLLGLAEDRGTHFKPLRVIAAAANDAPRRNGDAGPEAPRPGVEPDAAARPEGAGDRT